MNDRQTKSLNEFRDLMGVLSNYPEEIARYAIVQAKVGEFKGLLDLIGATAKLTASDTKGVTQSKSAVKKQMATLGAELASAALSYAYDEKDPELEGVFSLSYSEIQYAKDEDSLNLVEMLRDELNKIAPEKRDEYLIFEADLERLGELSDQFEGLSQVQGGKQADARAAHKKLNILFKQTRDLLRNSLDRLMLRLKRREPDMVEAYFNARNHSNLYVETEGFGNGLLVTE